MSSVQHLGWIRVVPTHRSWAGLRAALRRPAFLAGLAIVLLWLACALVGPSIAPQPWDQGDVLARHLPPSGNHWFGTDRLGRDVFARVVAGAREVLVIAPLATAIGTLVGTAAGLVMGYAHGILRSVCEVVVNALLALPALLVAMVVVAAVGGRAPGGYELGQIDWAVVGAIALSFVPVTARTVRAVVLVERHKDYVLAARLRGERMPYVLLAEILPNATGPILVEFTVRLGYAIFAVSALSFLGVGLQPPSPNWGLAVYENRGYLEQAWWTVAFPCLAIASLIVAVNLVADSFVEERA